MALFFRVNLTRSWKGGMKHSDHATDETQDHAGAFRGAVPKGLYRLWEEPSQDGRREIYLRL